MRAAGEGCYRRQGAPLLGSWARSRQGSSADIIVQPPDRRKQIAGGSGKVDNINHLDAPARLEIFDWQSAVDIHIVYV